MVFLERKNAWEGYSTDQLEELDGLASRYIDFISNNKTERRCFAAAVKQAEAAGYESLENVVREGRTLEAGSKVWAGVHGKSLILAHIGTEPARGGPEHPGRSHRQPPFGPEAEPGLREQRVCLP